MARKLDPNDIKRLKSCKKFNASQNIEFLTEVDGEYTDLYLEQLEHDDAFTQTDFTDEYFGMKDAPFIPPPPCTCLTSVEMPWDMILIPPTPKKRPLPEEENSEEAKKSERERAELKQLTVSPITGDQLLTITQEFLADNIVEAEKIDKLRSQILMERGKLDPEYTVVPPFNTDKESDPDDPDQYVPCRARPPLKSYQVYDPECEVYNEPYLDRMMRYICEDEMEGAGPCTSHVEMPWHQLELPKNVVLRKGRAPCERRQVSVSRDPHRKCGPEYREQLRRHREMFGCVSNSACGIIACMSREDRERFDEQFMRQSRQEATCKECKSASQTEISPKTKVSLKFICPSNGEQATPPKKVISCLKKRKKQARTCSSMPTISLKASSCTCASKTHSEVSSATEEALPDKPPCKTRTERIAALLDSCKKEMEPLKDGINQLRERIRELKFPDLITCQDPNRQSYESGHDMGTGSSMGYLGMPPMPPMCYPPAMMCYPYPPCMYPPGGVTGIDPFAASADVTNEKDAAGRPKKCKCKSKRHRRVGSHQKSLDARSPHSEFEDRHRSRQRSSRSNRSRSRSRSMLVCSCKTCPSSRTSHDSKQGSKNAFSVSACEHNKSSGENVGLNTPTNKSSKQSKIPRLTPCTSKKSAANVDDSCSCLTAQKTKDATNKSNNSKASVRSVSESCDVGTCPVEGPSLSTQETDVTNFQSCTSNITGKSLKSYLSGKGDLLNKSTCNIDTCEVCDHTLTNQKANSTNFTSSTSNATEKGLKSCLSCKSDLSNKSASCNVDSCEFVSRPVTSQKTGPNFKSRSLDITEKGVKSPKSGKSDLSNKSECNADACNICSRTSTAKKTDSTNDKSCTSDITEKDVKRSLSGKSDLPSKSACNADSCNICSHSSMAQKTDVTNKKSGTSDITKKSVKSSLSGKGDLQKKSASNVDSREFGSPSRTTEKSDYKSCASNISGKSNLSHKSLTSEKKEVSVSETRTSSKEDRKTEPQPEPIAPEEPAIQSENKDVPDGTETEPAKTADDLGQRDSLVMVKSNSTQKSNCDLSTTPPSISKEKSAAATQSTSGKKKCGKCAVCQRPHKEKADAGVEVKQGRPVEEGKEKVCTARCNKHKSRDA